MSVYECPTSKEAFLRSLPSLRVSCRVVPCPTFGYRIMDTLFDQFPSPDPGLRSEDSNMVENLRLECNSFSIIDEFGPTWSGGGRQVVERERGEVCMGSVHAFPLAGLGLPVESWSGLAVTLA